MSPKRRAALFDMDRTLVRINTAPLYVRWQIRRGDARRRDLAKVLWWVARYSVGMIDAEAIARSAAKAMRGRDEPSFRADASEWVRDEVLPHVTQLARDELAKRERDGYVCAILTSSTPYAAAPLAAALGIEHVLATHLEVSAGAFTGELLPPFCYGRGKITAARQWAERENVDLAESVFFTDSISDLPMLEHVGEPVVVNPDPRLRVAAWRRGWPVVKWE